MSNSRLRFLTPTGIKIHMMNSGILLVALLLPIIFMASGSADETTYLDQHKTSFHDQDDFHQLISSQLDVDQNNADAQYYLGIIYQFGNGAPQDIGKAIHWYRLAAEQGHVDAQFALGEMFFYGDGLPQDRAYAHKWFRLAAMQGDTEAQFYLGRLYSETRGIAARYLVRAHMWFSIAAASEKSQVQELATIERDRLEFWMDSEQIRRANFMAIIWFERNPPN